MCLFEVMEKINRSLLENKNLDELKELTIELKIKYIEKLEKMYLVFLSKHGKEEIINNIINLKNIMQAIDINIKKMEEKENGK